MRLYLPQNIPSRDRAENARAEQSHRALALKVR